jgi:two-component SAPR family response regulator
MGTNTDYSLDIKKVPGFDYDTYPYLLLRESSQITLIDIANLKSYPLITDLEYTYTYDWIDGSYYNWAYKYMVVEGGKNTTTG